MRVLRTLLGSVVMCGGKGTVVFRFGMRLFIFSINLLSEIISQEVITELKLKSAGLRTPVQYLHFFET